MITLMTLVPTAGTATAFQETRMIHHKRDKLITEEWTLGKVLDHTEAGIIDESWQFTLQVPGTAGAGTGSLSALFTLFEATGVTGGSANLMQLSVYEPKTNATRTVTAYFIGMGEEQYLTPYEFFVDCTFRRYQGG